MRAALRSLWRRNRVLFVAFVVALVVTVFFSARLLLSSLYWADPEHRSRPVEGWMTPRYVAHSYDLPPEIVRSALGLEPGEGKRRTLEEIAEQSGLTLEEIQRRIHKAADAHHGNAP